MVWWIWASWAQRLGHKDLRQRAFQSMDVATKEVSVNMMLNVAKIAEFWSKLTGKAPITTYKNTLFVTKHFYVDASKAVEELGLPQTPIETAVADSVQWFRDNGYG